MKFLRRILFDVSDGPSRSSGMLAILALIGYGSYYTLTKGEAFDDFIGKVSASIVAVWFATFVIERQFSDAMRNVQRLHYSHFVKRISIAKAEICILDIWIWRLLEGDNYKEFQSAIIESVRNGVLVRILISHPESETFKSRAQSLAESRLFGDCPAHEVEVRMKSKISRLKDVEQTVINTLSDGLNDQLHESIKSKFQIRMYAGYIDFSMYQVDGVRYIGTHASGKLSTDNRQVKATGGLFDEYFGAQFERRWNKSVSLEFV